MKPITFACEATLPFQPDAIARQILDLTKWPDFHGYGLIPGIKAAEFEAQMPGVVGTRFRVTNTDGSSHVEEIIEWNPDRRLRLHMQEFSAPLSRLAARFVETWEFQHDGNDTTVRRTFELHAKSLAAWPFLWIISLLLRRAIARNLQEIQTSAAPQDAKQPQKE